MTNEELIEKTFYLRKAPMTFLLLLRVVTEKNRNTNEFDIEKDIDDMIVSPKRWHSHYKDKWCQIIKQTLYNDALSTTQCSTSQALYQYLINKYDDHGTQIAQRFTQLAKKMQWSVANSNVVDISDYQLLVADTAAIFAPEK